MSALLDKIAAAKHFAATSEQSLWRHTLASMTQCKVDKRKGDLTPLFCRGEHDMQSPSLFRLAPDQMAFETLLPLCDVSKPMESDGSSVLHVAAQRNWVAVRELNLSCQKMGI